MENPRYNFLMNRWRVEAMEVIISLGWLISPLIMFVALQYAGLIPVDLPLWSKWCIYIVLFMMHIGIANSITGERPRN